MNGDCTRNLEGGYSAKFTYYGNFNYIKFNDELHWNEYTPIQWIYCATHSLIFIKQFSMISVGQKLYFRWKWKILIGLFWSQKLFIRTTALIWQFTENAAIYVHAYIITADHFSLLISSMHSNLSDVTHFEKKMSTELK